MYPLDIPVPVAPLDEPGMKSSLHIEAFSSHIWKPAAAHKVTNEAAGEPYVFVSIG